MNINDLKNWQEEQTELNNKLAVPEYRKFCRENDLKFHFWDELPNVKFDPEIALKEQKLHKEALNCFNNLKPRFSFFNNKIYSYHFNGLEEVEFDSWEIEDFLNQSFEQNNRVSGLEKHLKSALTILGILFGLNVSIIALYLYMSFIGDTIPDLFVILFLLITMVPAFLIKKKYFSNPLSKYTTDKNKYIIRLEALKLKLKMTDENTKNAT